MAASLAGCADDVAIWQRVLNVQPLVFDYRDDPDGWLRYASLCRNAGNAALTESVLQGSWASIPIAKRLMRPMIRGYGTPADTLAGGS